MRRKGRIRIYPYRSGSRSATELRNAFCLLGYDCRVLRREESRYEWEAGDVVLNWGSTDYQPHPVLNSFSSVTIACSKTLTLCALKNQGIPCVEHTSNVDVAETWNDRGYTLFARAHDRSYAGNGIERIEPCAGIWEAVPLWTKAVYGREYRVHVVGDRAVRIQKRWLDGYEYEEFPIRSHANGYTFISTGFKAPHGLRELAIDAVKVLGLDFGAVDIINNGDPHVLEVNTAVGMEGSTAQAYAYALATEFIESGRGPRSRKIEVPDVALRVEVPDHGDWMLDAPPSMHA